MSEPLTPVQTIRGAMPFCSDPISRAIGESCGECENCLARQVVWSALGVLEGERAEILAAVTEAPKRAAILAGRLAAAEAELETLKEALRRIADPSAEWNAAKKRQSRGAGCHPLPFEIAAAALSSDGSEDA